MVGWWPLDEMTGPIAQDLAGANADDGTWMGAPSPVAGMVDGALCFDGTTDHVLVPDGPGELDFGASPGGDVSIDAWVRVQPGDEAGVQKIVDKREEAPCTLGYAFFLYDGRLGLQLADCSGPDSNCGPGASSACTNYFANPGSMNLATESGGRGG